MTDDPTKELLSKKEFEDLLLVEYETTQPVYDEISKVRTWKQIKKRLPKSGNLKFITVAVAAALVFKVLPRSFFDSREKAGATLFSETEILSYQADGTLQNVSADDFFPGQTLALKVKLSQVGFIALILEVNALGLQIMIPEQKIDVDSGQLLMKKGRVYAYQIEKDEKTLRFYILKSKTEKELSAKNQEISTNPALLIKEDSTLVEVKTR